MDFNLCLKKIPSGIIFTRWLEISTTAESQWYGDSYLDAVPSTWAMQQIGMGIVRHMANHIRFAQYTTDTIHNLSHSNAERSWRDQRREVSLPSNRWFSPMSDDPSPGSAGNTDTPRPLEAPELEI